MKNCICTQINMFFERVVTNEIAILLHRNQRALKVSYKILPVFTPKNIKEIHWIFRPSKLTGRNCHRKLVTKN